MDECDFSIAIIGLGLIGASFAMALRKLEPKKIRGVDTDPEVVKKAVEMGIIDEGHTDAGRVLPFSDLVIFAVYPEAVASLIKKHMTEFKSGTVITDTAGIKKKMLEEILPYLREDVDFIGGHPMAGNEGSGIDHADGAIFQGANYILTPTEKNRPENVELLQRIIKGIGCTNIRCISPDVHDEIISYVSHLPHVIAVSLVNANGHGEDITGFTGGSYRDATRVALINTSLWTELFIANRENIVSQIERLQEEMESLKTAVAQGNSHVLQNIMEKANSTRRSMVYA